MTSDEFIMHIVGQAEMQGHRFARKRLRLLRVRCADCDKHFSDEIVGTMLRSKPREPHGPCDKTYMGSMGRLLIEFAAWTTEVAGRSTLHLGVVEPVTNRLGLEYRWGRDIADVKLGREGLAEVRASRIETAAEGRDFEELVAFLEDRLEFLGEEV